MNTSSISARWFGFEHPHLDINYEVAVGTTRDGSYDVSHGFIDVRNATFYQVDGIDLKPLMVIINVKSSCFIQFWCVWMMIIGSICGRETVLKLS